MAATSTTAPAVPFRQPVPTGHASAGPDAIQPMTETTVKGVSSFIRGDRRGVADGVGTVLQLTAYALRRVANLPFIGGYDHGCRPDRTSSRSPAAAASAGPTRNAAWTHRSAGARPSTQPTATSAGPAASRNAARAHRSAASARARPADTARAYRSAVARSCTQPAGPVNSTRNEPPCDQQGSVSAFGCAQRLMFAG
jgi:hypothetical protein